MSDINELLDKVEDVDRIEIFNQFPNQHDIPFDDKFFTEIIESFEEYKDVYTPNLKVDHSSEQVILKELLKRKGLEGYTELPLLGKVKRLYQEGKSLYADLKDMPKIIKEELGKRFKTISPEFTTNFRGTGKSILQAITLTNRPSQRHIMDVNLSEDLNDEMVLFGGSYKLNDKEYIMTKKPDVTTDDITTEEGQKSFIENIKDSVKEMMSSFKPDPIVTPVDDPKDEPNTISLSDFEKYKKENDKVMNELKLKIIEDDKSKVLLSDQIAGIQDEARAKNADSICTTAMMNGVPKVVVDYCKPILSSQLSDNTFKLSHTDKEGKTIEADKSVRDFVEGLFKMYPDKVVMNDFSYTKLNEPGEDNDEDAEMDKINEKVKVLMSEDPTLSKHGALHRAGIEVRGGK